LKEQLDGAADMTLGRISDSIGPPSFAGIDDMFFSNGQALCRAGIARSLIRPLVSGDVVRDWLATPEIDCVVPYDEKQDLIPFDRGARWSRYLWLTRTASEGMVSFNKQTRRDLGEPWWSWYRWIPDRLRMPLSVVFTEVSTHNHFVLDSGGRAGPARTLRSSGNIGNLRFCV
jgi:hypothetical protein